MACRPTSPESLDALRELQRALEERGDHCLSILLAGVELYIRAGRDWELIERMRREADQMRHAIENTPSADDLRRLYES